MVGLVVPEFRLHEVEAFSFLVPAVALLPPALDDADAKLPEGLGNQLAEFQLLLDCLRDEREVFVILHELFSTNQNARKLFFGPGKLMVCKFPPVPALHGFLPYIKLEPSTYRIATVVVLPVL